MESGEPLHTGSARGCSSCQWKSLSRSLSQCHPQPPGNVDAGTEQIGASQAGNGKWGAAAHWLRSRLQFLPMEESFALAQPVPPSPPGNVATGTGYRESPRMKHGASAGSAKKSQTGRATVRDQSTRLQSRCSCEDPAGLGRRFLTLVRATRTQQQFPAAERTVVQLAAHVRGRDSPQCPAGRPEASAVCMVRSRQ